MNKALSILLALQLTGCATRLDLYAINGGCCAKDRFGAEAPSYPHVDLPASAVLDTLLLPLSVLTVLGVGFNATGGL
jgi:uncharacterized protein YceK